MSEQGTNRPSSRPWSNMTTASAPTASSLSGPAPLSRSTDSNLLGWFKSSIGTSWNNEGSAIDQSHSQAIQATTNKRTRSDSSALTPDEALNISRANAKPINIPQSRRGGAMMPICRTLPNEEIMHAPLVLATIVFQPEQWKANDICISNSEVMRYRTRIEAVGNVQTRVRLLDKMKETSVDLESQISGSTVALDGLELPGDGPSSPASTETSYSSLTNTVHLVTDSYTAPPSRSNGASQTLAGPMYTMTPLSQSSNPSPATPLNTSPSSPTSLLSPAPSQPQPSAATGTGTSQHRGTSSNGAKTNVILSSLLGGILGFVAIALVLFCALNAFRKMRLRKNALHKETGDSEFKSEYLRDRRMDPLTTLRDKRSYSGEFDDFVPSLSTPIHYDRSPFDSTDLLRINHLAPPTVPPMSTQRISRLRDTKSIRTQEQKSWTRAFPLVQPGDNHRPLRRAKAPPPPPRTSRELLSLQSNEAELPDKNGALEQQQKHTSSRVSVSSSIYSPLDELNRDASTPNALNTPPLDLGPLPKIVPTQQFELLSSSPDIKKTQDDSEVLLPRQQHEKEPKQEVGLNQEETNAVAALRDREESSSPVHDDGQGEYPEFGLYFEELITSPTVSEETQPEANRPLRVPSSIKPRKSSLRRVKEHERAQKLDFDDSKSSEIENPYENYLSFMEAYNAKLPPA